MLGGVLGRYMQGGDTLKGGGYYSASTVYSIPFLCCSVYMFT